MKTIKRKCEICHREFIPASSNSRKCNYCRNRKIQTKKCAVCQKEFKTELDSQKYCGKKCRTQSMRMNHISSAIYKVRFAILYRDNFRCQYCGATPQDGIKLHVDHIIPRKEGGNDDITNLITSCNICNLGKTGLLLEKPPLVGITHKTVEILSLKIISRQKLQELGLFEAFQQMLKLT